MATTSPPGTLTTAHLADLPIPSDVRISPDGARVIYTVHPFARAGTHPTSALWLADVGIASSARPLTSGAHHDTLPAWAPDSRTVAFVSDRGGEAGKASAIYCIRIDGGEAYALTPVGNEREIERIAWCPSGKFVAFTSADEKSEEQRRREREKDDVRVYGAEWAYARLRVVHVATREVITLVAGDAHVDVFSWSTDSRSITYVLQQTPDRNSPVYEGVTVERVNVARQKRTGVVKFPGPIHDLVCGAASTFFVAGVKPDSGCTSQAVYQVLEEEGADGSYKRYGFGDSNCAEKLLWTGEEVVVQVQSGLTDEVHSLETDHIIYRNHHRIATLDVLTSSSAALVFAMGFSTATSPVEIFTRTSNDDARIRLSTHGATIRDLHLPFSIHNIITDGPDGYPCDGLLYLPSPATTPPTPLPTIVYIHGGPYARVAPSFLPGNYPEVPYLLSAGYAVLSPNYRGGSSHGDAHAAAARGGMGGDDLADVLTLLRAAIAQGHVDEARVAIGGWSQGGFLSYWAAVRGGAPGGFHFRAADRAAGVVDWDMLALTSDAWGFEEELAGRAPWRAPPSSSSSSDDDPAPGRPGSAIWHLRQAHAGGKITPVLLLHGEQDVRVPVSQAEAFRRACERLRWPCEMAVYPREEHDVMERAHLLDMWERMRRFYDGCLA